LRRLLALLALLAALGVAALAQSPAEGEADDSDNGFILNFIEQRISGPGRRIRVQGVTGALSSRARIGLLTVADDDGVWLRLEGVEIDWSRVALLRRRLDVNRLAVDRIEFLRRPVPSEATVAERLPSVEAQPFRLPELPVAVRIAAIELPRIDLAEAALGQAAQLGATSAVDLARGALDATLDVRRLDGPGGALTLALGFSNATGVLGLDLALAEPEGGVAATVLDIENRPAIDLRLQGEGPLDDLDVAFGFDAGGARIADGDVRLRATPEGRSFVADFGGGLAPLVPAPYRPFFAGETMVDVAGVALAGGGVRVDQLAVRGAELDLTGALETAPDGFPRNLTLAGRLGDPRGPAVTLPIPGAATSAHSAVLHLAYGQGRRWTGLVVLDRLRAGEVEVEDLTLTLGGLAENLDDPASRNLTFALEGVATGVWSENPDIAAVLGTRLDLFADAALPPGGPLVIRQAQASGEDVALFAAGDLRGTTFDGRLAARLADLAPASGLAGRDLGGALDLRLDGSVDPLSGGFDLGLDGSAEDLRLGDPRLDGLLAGATTLGGRVARDAEGLRADGFRLANPQVEITADGRLTRQATDLAIDARLADLAALDPRLQGALSATGRASGAGGPVAVVFEAQVPEGRLLDRALVGARLGFDGEADGAEVRGAVRGGATLGDQPVAITADLAQDAAGRSLRDLAIEVGPNAVTGELTQPAGGLLLGALTVAAPDLAPLAALALVEASGAADATLRFAADARGAQGVEVAATARDVAAAGARLGALELDATVTDAFAAPLVQGELTVTGLSAAGIEVDRLAARADQTGADAMRIAADARLAIGTEARLAGDFERLPDGFAATLDALSLRQDGVAAALAAPATVTVAGGAVRLTPLALDLAGGRLTAQGEIAEAFDVDVTLERLPLSLANAVAPALGLEGVVGGALRITGPRAAPDARFDLAGEGVASAATREAGLPPAALSATGRTAENRLQIDARVTAPGGIEARATGSAPLGAGALALDLELGALPLPALDRLAGGRGLSGVVSGTARVGGTTADPRVEFDLRGAGVSATALQSAGVAPLAATARGAYARAAVTLAEAAASNDQGLAVRASGRIPLAGSGLDVRAAGEAPLGLADVLLAERSAQATGVVRFDLTATGALAQPNLAGSATLAGATFTDPLTNFRLVDVGADLGFAGQTLTLRSFRAAAPAGGAITASGTVSLAAGNPADLVLRFEGLRYTDGAFVATTIDGVLRAQGPLTGGGTISGRIDLGPTEISVAEGLGGNAAAVVDEVTHVRPPPRVVATLERARVGEPRTGQATAVVPLNTDIRINAPNQIFVRGRGLDAELGGGLTLTGPLNDLAPIGQFDLRRGRIQVLGQRIDFDQGSLTLTGNFNPQINFVARTRAEDVTAIVTVTGRVSSPDIVFSSEPPLPPDEVLARVLFNRSIARLSAFQIAQLAVAAAELAGGGTGGPGVLGQLRGAIGFDDLDIVTEEGGATALRAGRYLDENLYLDVQTDTEGASRAQINLELTDNLTVRGSVATDGNSTLGVFFERDY
jgi:translocation and assembly module TamB